MVEQETPIFALDIGTRSVIGVLLNPLADGKFEVLDIKMVEHIDRSMLDGQIHDVLAVSDTIQKVKNQLEQIHGPLPKAAVAAAGRALKTRRVTLETSIEGQPLLRKEDIRAFELSAIQEAQKQLINSESEDMTHYHCVGYSVVNYFLDNQIIGSLIDQRGRKAAVEIIATFLPRVVVDSLISSLHRSSLEMEALTLEPIAAIHVLIPPSMRKLNIAFVDIGAGTSDIAITSEGTIVAYGMVPIAGDEITEAISHLYLLDFNIAEEIKRKLNVEELITFTDILGKTYELPAYVIIEQIREAVLGLASNISTKILELNKKPPQAVMLVGGGSQTPLLTEVLAEILGLSPQRVAVRGADAIQQRLVWQEDFAKGPELVTPIGIGISSKENPIQYLTFYVNNEIIHLFEMKSLTIGDALIAAAIPVKNLFGKPGLAMTIKINDKVKMIPGEHGTLPEILLNNETASLDSKIKNGDKIVIKPGINGKDSTLTIFEALNYSPIKPLNLTIDGSLIKLPPLVEVNGIDTGYNTPIKDRESINFYHVKTIEEALVLAEYSTIPFTEKIISIQLGEKGKTITYSPKKLFRNNQLVGLKEKIYDGDTISFGNEIVPYPTIKDILAGESYPVKVIEVTFNGTRIKVEPSSLQILMNNQKVQLDSPILPDSIIEITANEEAGFLFSDVFRYADFDTTNNRGSTKYVIRINGLTADFNSPIKHGDKLELFFE